MAFQSVYILTLTGGIIISAIIISGIIQEFILDKKNRFSFFKSMAYIVSTRLCILIFVYIIVCICLQFQETIKEYYRIGLIFSCAVYLDWFVRSYLSKTVFYKKTSLHKFLIRLHFLCCIIINTGIFIIMFFSEVLSGIFIIILLSLVFFYIILLKGGIII